MKIVINFVETIKNKDYGKANHVRSSKANCFRGF